MYFGVNFWYIYISEEPYCNDLFFKSTVDLSEIRGFSARITAFKEQCVAAMNVAYIASLNWNSGLRKKLFSLTVKNLKYWKAGGKITGTSPHVKNKFNHRSMLTDVILNKHFSLFCKCKYTSKSNEQTKYSTKIWIHLHEVVKGKDACDCAEISGVNNRTIV